MNDTSTPVKATPGPWRRNGSYIEGPKMALHVATVATPALGAAPETKAEADANGDLIAMAPEMLAAIKSAIRTIASMGGDLEVTAPESINANSYEDELRRLRVVVAMAEGRS